jgi:hypothetical protein
MTVASVTKRAVLALAFAPLLTGAAMSTDAPQPLPYTLQEWALALPEPMPTTREAVQAFLNTSLRHQRDTPSMRLYDIAVPLITRDGYVIEQVDVREAMPRSNHWRADGHNLFALGLEFAATPCVPAGPLRQMFDLPRFPTSLSGPLPNDVAGFGRTTERGDVSILVTNAQPNCAIRLAVTSPD